MLPVAMERLEFDDGCPAGHSGPSLQSSSPSVTPLETWRGGERFVEEPVLIDHIRAPYHCAESAASAVGAPEHGATSTRIFADK